MVKYRRYHNTERMKLMTYSYGQGAENGTYDVIVDINGEGEIEILSEFGSDRVVDLGTLRNPSKFKYFEILVQELLKEVPDTANVFFTDDAVKVINDYVVGNRGRYFNRPLEKFSLNPLAPTTVPV